MKGKIVVGVFLFVGAFAGVVACLYHARHPGAPDATVSIARPAPDPILSRVVSSGPMARPRDAFRVIDPPHFLAAAAAADAMSDDEVVLGLEIGDVRRAYPINYLNDHEMVREQIGDLPLLVTW